MYRLNCVFIAKHAQLRRSTQILKQLPRLLSSKAGRGGDSDKIHHVKHHSVEKTPITARLWSERVKAAASESSNDASKTPAPSFLLTKTSGESRMTVRYNFSTDQSLYDLYVDSKGNVLTGKLLEDLDALAGNVAFTHCDDNNPQTRPLNLVTASVDKIQQNKRISASEDIILVGQVAWVGKSSLDVLMEIHKVKDIKRIKRMSTDTCTTRVFSENNSNPSDRGGNTQPVNTKADNISVEGEEGDDEDLEPEMIEENVSSRLLSSLFTYVAKDRMTGKPCAINHFKPSTTQEEELFARRDALSKSRKAAKAAQKQALLAAANSTASIGNHSTSPLSSFVSMSGINNISSSGNSGVSVSEEIVNSLVERGQAMEDMPSLAHPNAVLMKRTVLENCLLCRPQNANTAGRVFGGFMMHRAFDLAQATAYMFAGSYPNFSEVDRIEFSRPVDIGDLVRLRCRVVYTSDDPASSKVKVEVTAQVMRPERASSYVSNTLFFEFKFDNAISLKRILPTTHEEAITLIKAAGSESRPSLF